MIDLVVKVLVAMAHWIIAYRLNARVPMVMQVAMNRSDIDSTLMLYPEALVATASHIAFLFGFPCCFCVQSTSCAATLAGEIFTTAAT